MRIVHSSGSAPSTRTLFAIGVLTLLAGACGSPAPGADRPSAETAQLFATVCGRCHGADGSGGVASVPNGPKPIDLRNVEWQKSRTDEDIANAIGNGRGGMPPFAGVLTPDQIRALTAYVRQLASPARR